VTEEPPDYAVGYKKPPLHSRFKKGQSGNPEGGRRRRDCRKKRLPALLEEALDRRPATTRGRIRRPATRPEAVVVALVEKSAAGDLRAVKLLLDLVQKTELAAGPEPGSDEDDPREFLRRELDRLAAAQAAEEVAEIGHGDAGEEPTPVG